MKILFSNSADSYELIFLSNHTSFFNIRFLKSQREYLEKLIIFLNNMSNFLATGEEITEMNFTSEYNNCITKISYISTLYGTTLMFEIKIFSSDFCVSHIRNSIQIENYMKIELSQNLDKESKKMEYFQ